MHRWLKKSNQQSLCVHLQIHIGFSICIIDIIDHFFNLFFWVFSPKQNSSGYSFSGSNLILVSFLSFYLQITKSVVSRRKLGRLNPGLHVSDVHCTLKLELSFFHKQNVSLYILFLVFLLLFNSINCHVIERGSHNNGGQRKMVSDPVAH